jgi:hypothetical protein
MASNGKSVDVRGEMVNLLIQRIAAERNPSVTMMKLVECQRPVRGLRWWPSESPHSSFLLLTVVDLGSSSDSGLFHAVAFAVGDNDVAVVQEPVEHADRGGVFG